MSTFKNDLNVMISQGYKLKENNMRIRLVIPEETVTISELNFSTRAENALKRANIFTLEMLIDKQADLSHVRNLGEKCVKEIKNKVLNYCYERMTDEQKKRMWIEILC